MSYHQWLHCCQAHTTSKFWSAFPKIFVINRVLIFTKMIHCCHSVFGKQCPQLFNFERRISKSLPCEFVFRHTVKTPTAIFFSFLFFLLRKFHDSELSFVKQGVCTQRKQELKVRLIRQHKIKPS